MRIWLTFVVVILVLAVQPAFAAKTVLFVTNSPSLSSCTELGATDQVYCSRLQSLGYTVRVLHQNHTNENTATWNSEANSASMIFVGAATYKSPGAFCHNLAAKASSSKRVFFTSNSTLKNGGIGCAFSYPAILGIDWSFSNNICNSLKSKVLNYGYPTEDLSLDQLFNVYSSAQNIGVATSSGPANEKWLGTECSPGGSGIEYHSSSFSTTNAAFWGYQSPSFYTDDLWGVFDKLVEHAIGDSIWLVSVKVVPNTTTYGSQLWIMGEIKKPNGDIVSTGTANFTLRDIYGPSIDSGKLSFDGNLWKNTSAIFPKFTTDLTLYKAYIYIYSKSGLRGSAQSSRTISAGNLTAVVHSPQSYTPNQVIPVNISYYSGSQSTPLTSCTVHVQQLSDLSYIQTVQLTRQENYCSGNVAPLSDIGPVVFSYIGSLTNKFGGGFFLLSPQVSTSIALSTNKDSYRPGETVEVSLTSNFDIQQASLSIVDGTPLIENLQMVTSDSRNFAKNYTLGTKTKGGTYKVRVTYTTGGQQFTTEKTITVLSPMTVQPTSWILTATSTGGKVQTFKLFNNATDALGNISFSAQGFTMTFNPQNISTIASGDSKNFTATLSVSSEGTFSGNINVLAGGTSVLEIPVSLTVTIPITGNNIVLTPPTLSVVTIPGKSFIRGFTVKNIASRQTSPDINVTGIDFVTVESSPSSLQSDTEANIELSINTIGVSPSTYSGTLNVESDVGSATAAVSVEVLGDLVSEADARLNELASLKDKIDSLEAEGRDVSSLRSQHDSILTLLTEVKSDYINEDYISAKTKFAQAEDEMSSLNAAILSGAGNEGGGEGVSIIWTFAGVIVFLIVVVTGYRYRERIKDFFRRLFKKKGAEEQYPEETPQEQQYPEYYPESDRERTEYY